MLERFIHYFATRHLLTNIITIMVFMGEVFFWFSTPKEELPDVEMNFVRVTVSYPGSTAEDIEYFIIRPIEEKLKGVDGLYKIESTAGSGTCSLQLDIDPSIKDISNVVNEIRSAISDSHLPAGLLNLITQSR